MKHNTADAGLVNNTNRHYNPADGRWTGRDPYCAMYNYNLYCMCNNSLMSFYDRQGLAGEITHGIERCKNEDTCLSLSIKASKWIKAYSVRHRELAQDKYNYKQRDPRRYNNHIDEIEKCKNHVKKCLTILTEKIKKNQCCKPGDRKPESIPNFSPKPTPERIPENNNFSLSHEVSQTDKVVEGVVYAGGAALASYVVYRAVRLLPSLFPLLWPTLVPNIVLP